MKKIIATFALLVFSLGASAQQDNIDQIQQEPPRETQAQLERAAAHDARNSEAEKKQKEAEAQKVKEEAQKEAELKANRESKSKKKSKKK